MSNQRKNFGLVEDQACPIRFLITDCPQPTNTADYLDFLKGHQVCTLFRLCEPSAYDPSTLIQGGIDVVDDCRFEDGKTPPADALQTYRQKLKDLLDAVHDDKNKITVALHCISGVGRAPVLAAVGILDYTKLSPDEVVDRIRKARRGAFNKLQLNWLLDEKYIIPKKSLFAKIFKRN